MMKRVWTSLSMTLLGLAAAGNLALAGGRVVETFPEPAAGRYDRSAAAQSQRELHDRLMKSQVAAARIRPIVVAVTDEDLRLIAAGAATERRIRVGIGKQVAAQVDFSDLTAKQISGKTRLRPFGAVRGDKAGRYVWTSRISSPGASALRVHFRDVRLPRGAELYVYNAAGQAFGPYTGRGPLGTGEFWSHTLRGEELYVQLHQTEPAFGRAARFLIQGVGYIAARFPTRGPAADELCPYNASCVVNASCQSSPAVADAKKGVAMILFASGNFLFICSGGLLTDTDTSTQIPFFLTANHCISRSREAASVEAYFDFTTPCGTCDDVFSDEPRTLGSTIVAKGKTSDYTLLQLSEPAPAGTVFLGWNSTAVASSNGTALFRISHPAGAPQAYSEHAVDTSKPTCGSWPRGPWIYSQDLFGATEGGSSGSPVVNSAGQVVGQLSGACGFNVNDPCDAASNATVDGAFAAYFADVQQWLDPGSGGCLPAGSACTSNSECCSDSCKGPPGRKTCR